MNWIIVLYTQKISFLYKITILNEYFGSKILFPNLQQHYMTENSALTGKFNEVKIENRFQPWKFPAKIKNFPVTRLPYYPLSSGLGR